MPPQGVIQRAFAGGELAPALHARADLAKYVTGLRTCQNFLVLKSGGVANRAGLRFIGAAKTNSASVKLMRYISENQNSSLLIEHGLGYFRFYQGGARVNVSGVAAWSAVTTYIQGDLVVEGGVHYYAKAGSLNQQPPNAAFWHPLTGTIYEVPAPQTADLYNWTQSGRVITLTHPNQQPQELTFVSLTRWTILPVSTQPSIGQVVGGAGVAGAAGTRTLRYQVTAVKAETYEEGNPSATITIVNTQEGTEAAPNTLSWTATAGAVEYYVYEDPFGNGVFGFIGTASTNAFNDTGFVPDFAVTPPIPRTLFATANNYPAVAAHYQQRRWFAFTNNEPEGIWASRVGFPSNFGISSPLQDDDALTLRIVGETFHPVRHLLGLRGLVVLTDAGGHVIGGPQEVLSPSNIPVDQQLYVGSHDKAPVVVGNAIIYIQNRGNVVSEARFDQQVEGLGGRDLTIYATHLFEAQSIGRLGYARVPNSIVWATRGNGTLLGLTYIPEQELWGWHRHTSGAGASFDDVCVVPEAGQDAAYFIVSRNIGGSTVRYIERMESRVIEVDDFDDDAFFVDSGLSYDGAPATVFTGLAHLNGQLVAVVGDGSVIFNGDASTATPAQITQFTVAGGQITLSAAKSKVHIGLPIQWPDLETLDLDVAGVEGRDKQKAVHNVSVIVDRSSRSFWAGPDSAHLRQVKLKPWETVADESTGQVEVALTATFNKYGRVLIRQKDPLPLAILGIIPSVELGG